MAHATESDVLDRIKFQLETWTRQNAKARQNVAENVGGDWGQMEELAKAFGRERSMGELINLLDRMEEQPARFTLVDLLERMNRRATEELMRVRLFNSTSLASNMIGMEKMYSLQSLAELSAGWLLVAKAL